MKLVTSSFSISQGNLQLSDPPNSLTLDSNYCDANLNGFISIDCERETGLNAETCVRFPPDQLEMKGTTEGEDCIQLSQRLMAALISEDEDSDVCNDGEDVDMLKAYGSSYELDGEFESNGLNNKFLANFQLAESAALNGYVMPGNPDQNEPGSNCTDSLNIKLYSKVDHSSNGFTLHEASMTNMACSEFQYANMNINDKLLLEIQSVGIFPGLVVGLYLFL